MFFWRHVHCYRSVDGGFDHHPAVSRSSGGKRAWCGQRCSELPQQADGCPQVCTGGGHPWHRDLWLSRHHILCFHLSGMASVCHLPEERTRPLLPLSKVWYSCKSWQLLGEHYHLGVLKMYLFKSDMFVHNHVFALNILPNISLPFSKIVLVIILAVNC